MIVRSDAVGRRGCHERPGERTHHECAPPDRAWVRVARTDRSGTALRYERKGLLATYLAFHEVEDVQHWLSSPKREEIFGPMGITARTFHDPEGSNRVGLIVEIPDMAAFQEVMQSEAAAEAMKYDGVHPETLLILSEG